MGTVLQLMHTLKYYYWAVSPVDNSGIMPKGLGKLIWLFSNCVNKVYSVVVEYDLISGAGYLKYSASIWSLIQEELSVLGKKSLGVNQSQSQSQACYQSVFLKWQQLPHIRNDSSPHGSTCLSAVRTAAITGDDSETDMPHQYRGPPRVFSVVVRPLKPGPVLWQACFFFLWNSSMAPSRLCWRRKVSLNCHSLFALHHSFPKLSDLKHGGCFIMVHRARFTHTKVWWNPLHEG